jgi:hypothetical protein
MGVHKYALRVPDDLWVELVAAAGRSRRSVNQEIVWRLSERAVEKAEGSAVEVRPRSESSPDFEKFRGMGEKSFKPDFGSRLKEK